MNVLGVSAHYHDSAACLLRDGKLIAAVQEEAFTRKKHDARLPTAAIDYCLREAQLTLADLDWIGYYELPRLKYQRILAMHAGGRDDALLNEALRRWPPERLDPGSYFPSPYPGRTQVLAAEHHISHAASAFFPSPFDEAAILTVDGVGEYATTSIGHGRGNRVEQLASISFPHSLGLFYSAFTAYAGFKVNSGEYKLMGLAPYGEPTLVDIIEKNLLRIGSDGSFKLNIEYFAFLNEAKTINQRFEALFGAPARRPEEPLTQHYMNVARSAQVVLERALLALAHKAHKLTGCRQLCMAGGVALNCVANSRLLREGPFEQIWVQPAAGDAGGALGIASYVWHQHLGNPREVSGAQPDGMQGAYLGPSYSDEEIRVYLVGAKAVYSTLTTDALLLRVAKLLASGQVVGWFQGRMEFGPRALGNRSILADPRDRDMQRRLNLKIKERESFRPFAPAVLAEDASTYFDFASPSPYMLFVAPVAERLRLALTPGERALSGTAMLAASRSTLPAITHVDYSARLQTVHAETNSLFAGVLRAFKELTGCPVLVNTSFNVRGEPIVCSPEDALRCFARTEMDYLVLGHHLLAKSDQRDLLIDPGSDFELD